MLSVVKMIRKLSIFCRDPEGHLIPFRGLSRKETRTEKLPKLSMSGLARVEQAPSRGLMES